MMITKNRYRGFSLYNDEQCIISAIDVVTKAQTLSLKY